MTTAVVVVGSVLLVGHVTALFADSPAAGWGSAAAFEACVLLYATLSPTGRRCGFLPFLIGGASAAPAFLLWLGVTTSLDAGSWYDLTFGGFRVGLSDRGWGHAGEIWLALWVAQFALLIALALAVRHLLVRRSRAAR